MSRRNEATVYIGDGTAAAAIMRNQRVSAGLQSTPGRWFGTVIAALLGRRIDVTPKGLQDKRAWARGMLAGLGYDPDTHELVRKGGVFPGLVVRDAAGKPVRGVSQRQLHALQFDDGFLERFDAETSSAE